MKFPDAIYKITWHDAHSTCLWKDKDEFDIYKKERMIITEIGWIVHEDKDIIILCSQVAGDTDLGNMTRIPKGMILSRLG